MTRACFVVLLTVSAAIAQFDSEGIIRHLKLRLSFGSGVCDPTARVQLMGRNGPVADRKPDDECEVDVANVPSGAYRVEVSGQNFAESEEITTANGVTDFELKLRGANDGVRMSRAPLVSAGALSIPAKAVKEFDKSNELIKHQEYQKAIQSLNRAIAIYPAYAAAYNNLGAVYQRLGDQAKEREALQRAVSLDDHLAAAYLNLGRMDIANNDFPAGEGVLSKAASSNPSDPMALVLLSYCQFQDRHFDDAIATSHKAHPLQGQHSTVHLVAAKAFEQKHDAVGAIAELELFLEEESAGERADQARKDLKVLRAIHQ